MTTDWKLKTILNEECLSYVLYNESSREALLVDPKKEEQKAYQKIISELAGYRLLAVIDTHTHADHISCAANMAEKLNAPLIMHERAPSRRVHLRVGKNFEMPTVAGPMKVLQTPGHTADGLCVLWGPYLFTGDTILYGDTGRDDLPTGDPAAHFESLELIKKNVSLQTLVLPGHDNKGGRISTWEEQLRVNPSLTQDRETFIREASAFVGKPPAQFKESLFENFK